MTQETIKKIAALESQINDHKISIKNIELQIRDLTRNCNHRNPNNTNAIVGSVCAICGELLGRGL